MRRMKLRLSFAHQTNRRIGAYATGDSSTRCKGALKPENSYLSGFKGTPRADAYGGCRTLLSMARHNSPSTGPMSTARAPSCCPAQSVLGKHS